MYHCPSCGGQLKFDIATQNMKCERCNAQVTITDAKTLSPSDADDSLRGFAYTCPNCGGEVFSTDVTIVNFCSHCGSNVLLKRRMVEKVKPERIIPFKIDKEKCVQNYRAYIRSRFCVDSHMAKDAVVDSFRAVYVPYCNFCTTTKGTVRGEVSERNGSVESIYLKGAEISFENNWHLHSLSTALPEAHAACIHDFESKDSVPFSPAYLAGFYADVPDMEPCAYREEMIKQNGETVAEAFYEQNSASRPSAAQLQEMTRDAAALTQISAEEIVLLPVWLMSVRHRGRMYYAMVNGATGRVSADLPVNYKYFFPLAGLVSALLFSILLPTFLTMKPNEALAAAAAMLAAISYLADKQLMEPAKREKHTDNPKQADKRPHADCFLPDMEAAIGVMMGTVNPMQMHKHPHEMEEEYPPRPAEPLPAHDQPASTWMRLFVLFLCVIVAIPIFTSGAAETSFVVLCIPLLLCIRCYFHKDGVKSVGLLLNMLTCALGTVLILLHLPYNMLHCAAAVLMLLSGLYCEWEVIRTYNKPCSSPMPALDTHRGGDGRA